MTKQIWKYPLHKDLVVLKIPSGARFSSLLVQADSVPCLYFHVEARNPLVERSFRIVNTGETITKVSVYLASYQIDWFVGHIHEEF